MTLKTFNDLEFVENEDSFKRARIQFDNGWYASVVIGPYSYGGDSGKYELAILDEDGNICYDSELDPGPTVTGDDIFGFLSEEDVTKLLAKIQMLKPTKRVNRQNKIKNILDDTISD